MSSQMEECIGPAVGKGCGAPLLSQDAPSFQHLDVFTKLEALRIFSFNSLYVSQSPTTSSPQTASTSQSNVGG